MAFKRVYSMSCPVLQCNSPSLTRQEFQHDADMNVIVDRFLRTGVLDQPNAGRPMVDGLESPGDFTEASNLAYEQLHELNSSSESGSETSSESGSETSSESGSDTSSESGSDTSSESGSEHENKEKN